MSLANWGASALGVGHHSVRHIHHPRLEGAVPERVARGDVVGERNEEEVCFVWVLCKEGDVLERGIEVIEFAKSLNLGSFGSYIKTLKV